MANVNMSIQDTKLMERLAGEEYPYAEAITAIKVPIEGIQLDRIISDKYDTKIRTSKNGKADITHSAVLLHDHSLMPDRLKEIGSLSLYDFHIARIPQDYQIAEEMIPMYTAAEIKDDGSYDCAFLKVLAVQRIVGNTYQRKGGDPFVISPSEDGRYDIGDVKLSYEVSPLMPFTLPNYVRRIMLSDDSKAKAEANMRKIEAMQLKQQQARTAIPDLRTSDEEKAARIEINKLKNAIAEHNALIDSTQAQLDSGKLTPAKAKTAEEKIGTLNEELKTFKSQLADAESKIED
jgi:hypothetical protein